MAVDKITGEIVKSAISRTIKALYPDKSIYKEPQNQNITSEAFYIRVIRVSQSDEISTIKRRNYEMEVRYETEINSQRQIERCADVSDTLMFALRCINLGKTNINGIDMSYEIIDGVAIIYVTYSMRIAEVPENITAMNKIEINNN